MSQILETNSRKDLKNAHAQILSLGLNFISLFHS